MLNNTKIVTYTKVLQESAITVCINHRIFMWRREAALAAQEEADREAAEIAEGHLHTYGCK